MNEVERLEQELKDALDDYEGERMLLGAVDPDVGGDYSVSSSNRLWGGVSLGLMVLCFALSPGAVTSTATYTLVAFGVLMGLLGALLIWAAKRRDGRFNHLRQEHRSRVAHLEMRLTNARRKQGRES